MFDEKEQSTTLDGVTVQDAWIALQIVEKAAASGVIQPNEFEIVGQWRGNMVKAIEQAVGKNFDAEALKIRQAQAAAQQAATQGTPAEDASDE